MGVTWHGHYLGYLETARSALLNRIGYNFRQMTASGYAWPIVDLKIKYVKTTTFGQRLAVAAQSSRSTRIGSRSPTRLSDRDVGRDRDQSAARRKSPSIRRAARCASCRRRSSSTRCARRSPPRRPRAVAAPRDAVSERHGRRRRRSAPARPRCSTKLLAGDGAGMEPFDALLTGRTTMVGRVRGELAAGAGRARRARLPQQSLARARARRDPRSRSRRCATRSGRRASPSCWARARRASRPARRPPRRSRARAACPTRYHYRQQEIGTAAEFAARYLGLTACATRSRPRARRRPRRSRRRAPARRRVAATLRSSAASTACAC